MKSDHRYQILFEQAPFSMQLLAPSGRTLRVNAAWKKLWNIEEGGGLEFVLDSYNILEDPQLEKKGIAQFLRRAFSGETVAMPAISYDPAELGIAGRVRWVTAHAHPIKDEHGSVAEVMLIHQDVTDRVTSEVALKASEQRLKQIANSIPQLAWMAHPDAAIHWYNDRWYEYTGKTEEEMAGFGWQTVHDPAWLPKVRERMAHCVATGEPFEMTFPLRGRDGRYRPFFTLAEPLKDEEGKVISWFGTNTDVSSLQESQAELRKAEERLRLATEAGGIGIWEWQLRDGQVSWSDRVYELHGVAPGCFGGTLEAFEALVHPDDRPGLGARIQAAVSSGDPFSAEFRVVLPDGSARWLSTWAIVQRSAEGVPERMVGATISVDAYKKAEGALRESDRRKDEFLAMLAHELRNPMAPIHTAAQLLVAARGDGEIVRKAGEIINRQVRHMSTLIDDLLDVSRVTRGLVELEFEDVDLTAIVNSAVEQVKPLIQGRQHVLTLDLAPGPIMVRADRTRLIQVIANLLNNAAKYTPPGGSLKIEVQASNGVATVSVTDNGQGIEPELKPYLFELFTQGSRTPDRSQGGLGIGLSLVRSLLTLHSGSVAVESLGRNKGSRFTVTLPTLRADAVSHGIEQVAAKVPALPSRRIVLIDDNEDGASSMASLMMALGHRVQTFNCAEELLAAEFADVDVFIIDIGLPGMDGWELASTLKARPGNNRALYLALTGYGQARDMVRSKGAGFDAHLVKPVDIERLLEAIRKGGASP
ncbi:MAG TPA: PAS domain-containing protein [Solimonas sp.]|nr:PAS domain-containing protein [Solimonas sp.]